MEILVFKTNIPEIKPVVEQHLRQHEGISQWSIDFGDRDKVLRVEAHNVQPVAIVQSITAAGFECEELV